MNILFLTGFYIWIAAIIGWCMNLYIVATMFFANSPVTTMFVGRAIGILVAPLGAILGLLLKPSKEAHKPL